jgi:hypothetical protein
VLSFEEATAGVLKLGEIKAFDGSFIGKGSLEELAKLDDTF